jgi:hypothetical protein
MHLLLRSASLMSLALLGACSGGTTSDQATGGVSPSEAAALNDAAEMLDKSEADGNVAAPAQ